MKSTLILVAALAATPALGVNILSNPGFESGALSPWFQSADFGGPEDWNVTSADAHSGIFSATDVGNKLIQQDFGPVDTADITQLSFWLKNVDGSINAVFFAYDDGSTEENIISHVNGEWNFYDYTSFLDGGKNLKSFGVYGVNGGGNSDRTYLDDAVVDVIPTPGAVALLGAAGLVGLRRRR